MAITYTKKSVGTTTDLTAVPASGGSLTASTQFWFVVVPIDKNTSYATTSAAIGKPTNIATATTDATNKTINLSWSACTNALGYIVYWTKTDPGTNPSSFNYDCYQVKSTETTAYNVSVTTNSFSFTRETITGVPPVSVPYTNVSAFVQIIDDNCDYITISGSSDSDRASIEKLYQYCVANSWDSVQKTHDRTYYIKANITIGSSSVFESKNELIYSIGSFIVASSGISYFGTGTSELDPNNGTTWISLAGNGAAWNKDFTPGIARMFNFHFRNIRQGYISPSTSMTKYTSVTLNTDFQVANCVFDSLQYLDFAGTALSTSYVKDTVVSNSRWAWRFATDLSQATFDNIFSINSGTGMYLRYNAVAKGFNLKGVNAVAAIAINSAEDLGATLIDSNLDWSFASLFSWYLQGKTPTGNEYIRNKYTILLTVVDESNNYIEGATIKMTNKDGTQEFLAVTDENGKIEELALAGVHRSKPVTTTNTGVYTSYSPFTLTIKKSGYKTYLSRFTLSKKFDEIITLKSTKDIADEDGNYYIANDETSDLLKDDGKNLIEL
jgi:hypothetical protein